MLDDILCSTLSQGEAIKEKLMEGLEEYNPDAPEDALTEVDADAMDGRCLMHLQ